MDDIGSIQIITIDDSAKNKITELYEEENDPEVKGLRIFVQGGGCSGFQYGFTWDKEINEDDFVFDITNDVKLLVDTMSSQYLQGTTVKYKKELGGEQFVMENPNVTTKCGCGSSFGV
jgi:iron-sulfur cluster insertion protein